MSSHMKTEAEAQDFWPCPLSRTFADGPVSPKCRGSVCPVWRWQVSDAWRRAVVEVAKTTGESGKGVLTANPKAAAIVAAEPQKYGCEGICGLGGAR